MKAGNATLDALNNGQLKGATELDLQADLSELPESIFSLADTLEVLSLNNNQLTDLPERFKAFKKLRILFCSNNPFTTLPKVLGECPALEMIGFKACNIRYVPEESLAPSLRWLILTNNQIECLPDSIGHCHSMQKLMLAGNRLRALPDTMSALHKLELLRISANQFEALPAWLFSLPKLAWLALAGNPINLDQEQHALFSSQLTHIEWQQLSCNQRLGEGASGEIFHANWQQSPDKMISVALKIFKGNMTSDGLPSSELAASLAAGQHACLTTTLGLVDGHPTGNQATVMALLDPSFSVLAGPPSFTSCTRDVYAADQSMTIATAIRIATQVADATLHLHNKGLIHGDLYAHNILLNDDADCLVSDFGGASFLPAEHAKALQRIEVRAFGYLLEELIILVNRDNLPSDSSTFTEALNTLVDLKERCLNETPNERPLMTEIYQVLNNI